MLLLIVIFLYMLVSKNADTDERKVESVPLKPLASGGEYADAIERYIGGN